MNRPVYTMRLNSPRKHEKCAACQQRIRLGRKFVVGAVDSKAYHAECYKRVGA